MGAVGPASVNRRSAKQRGLVLLRWSDKAKIALDRSGNARPKVRLLHVLHVHIEREEIETGCNLVKRQSINTMAGKDKSSFAAVETIFLVSVRAK